MVVLVVTVVPIVALPAGVRISVSVRRMGAIRGLVLDQLPHAGVDFRIPVPDVDVLMADGAAGQRAVPGWWARASHFFPLTDESVTAPWASVGWYRWPSPHSATWPPASSPSPLGGRTARRHGTLGGY